MVLLLVLFGCLVGYLVGLVWFGSLSWGQDLIL